VKDLQGRTAIDVACLTRILAPKITPKLSSSSSSSSSVAALNNNDDDDHAALVLLELDELITRFNGGGGGSGGEAGGGVGMVRWQRVFEALRDGPREESDEANRRRQGRLHGGTSSSSSSSSSSSLSPLDLVLAFVAQGCVDSEGFTMAHVSQTSFAGAGHTLLTMAAETHRPKCVKVLREAAAKAQTQARTQQQQAACQARDRRKQQSSEKLDLEEGQKELLLHQRYGGAGGAGDFCGGGGGELSGVVGVSFHKGMRQVHNSDHHHHHRSSQPVREKWVQTQMSRNGTQSVVMTSSFQLG
jgi:hypothetical protein